MVTEDYVSFETAKLLKEKGFDQNCATYYLDGQVWRHYHGEVIPKGKQIYAAPTQAIAMKWLREVHQIHISICICADIDNPAYIFYNPQISTFNRFGRDKNITYLEVFNEEEFVVYEVACEAAIKYCLEHLI